jgi:SAM-dependent methyltransferase
VSGIDISEQGIAAARAAAVSLRLGNVAFELRDAKSLEPSSHDLVTAFDVIHDLPDPRGTVAAIHAALKPNGVFLMVDIAASSQLQDNIDHPLGPALYTASVFHCLTVSLANDGPGLGTMWGEQQALELLADAGFADVQVKRIEADFLNAYYVARR